MSLGSGLHPRSWLRRWLGLPPRRCPSAVEREYVAMPDGVRLATTHLWPLGENDAPTVLIRTPYGVGGARSATVFGARLIAEAGYHVVLQDVRGRFASEGRYTPFHNEASDGAATLAWIAEQRWSHGKVGLVGASYLAYAAWAAAAAAPEHAGALVVAIGARDPWSFFYTDGAFGLATALDWATSTGERDGVPAGHIDLERGLGHRPLLEADRVALRRLPGWRDWLEHPRFDGYWEPLRAPLPDPMPPSLFVAGWWDLFLGPQLRDYADAVAAAHEGRAPTPELVVGPWAHGRVAHRRFGGRDNRMAAAAARETLTFLDRHLRGEATHQSPPVRTWGCGVGWREDATWPPAESEPRRLHLRAPDGAGDGRLCWEAPAADAPVARFVFDPADPTPSCGGPLFGREGGVADQREVEGRSDVLCYTSEPLERDLEIAGPVQLVLHAASSAPDTDFCAKLVDVAPDGVAWNVCEGIQRARWREVPEAEKAPHWLEPGAPERFEIDLWAACWRFPRGHRIRLEVASANFPRFDCAPNGEAEPAAAEHEEAQVAEQTLWHDAERPSHLVLPVREGG